MFSMFFRYFLNKLQGNNLYQYKSTSYYEFHIELNKWVYTSAMKIEKLYIALHVELHN